jgi:uncharacterized protein (TIGR02391 family)
MGVPVKQEMDASMPGLIDFFPDADSLAAVAPEDLGIALLQLIQQERGPRVTLSNLEMPLWNANTPAYPQHRRMEVGRAIAESWQWLQNEGLLMPDLDQPNGWFCLTRKGATLRTRADLEAYRQGNLLPSALLHPRLAEKVQPMFMRGDYDVAVFQSFKEVEVAVRAAARMSNSDIGRKLMQAAFNPDTGPLTDREADKGERVGLMDLFSGGIGYCKNPPGHRERDFDRGSAAQLIAFASYLLTQVETIGAFKATVQGKKEARVHMIVDRE